MKHSVRHKLAHYIALQTDFSLYHSLKCFGLELVLLLVLIFCQTTVGKEYGLECSDSIAKILHQHFCFNSCYSNTLKDQK